MAIASDFSVDGSGNIRHTGGTTVYSVLDLHAWLQDLADNATASGDDLVSILSSNPSKLDGPRATNKPMSLNLLGSFNIDDTAAQYINFGSISQASGGTLYTGVKTLGSLVSGTPIYFVQNGSKLTSYWPNGAVQIMVKGKTGGSLIDSGNIYAYSRKYGQTYAYFSGNLSAGGEQPFAISTALTDWTTLDKTSALALSSKVSITVADTNYDMGDGNGSKLYKGTIALSGGITVAEAAQYLQAICDEASTTSINGELGWKYRALNPAYTPNDTAPFGIVAGGKWFVAQGWLVTGVLAADSQKYQLTSHDGTKVSPPVITVIEIGNLVTGTRVLVGRDTGTDFNTTEYTLASATLVTDTTVTINEAIKSDTPVSGYIRIGGDPYTYTSYTPGTKTFTLSGAIGKVYAQNTAAWVPFLDKVAASSTETSANFSYNTNFTARVKARNGDPGTPYIPFETTFAVTSAGGSTNVILSSDE